MCVSTTAREAYQLGYEVVLPQDAIGDRDIPGASGEEVTKVGLPSRQLTVTKGREANSDEQMVMLELNDVFGTVVDSKDIQ